MAGKFYAVGVGPGDPQLLTIKAIKTMEESHVIVAPDSGADENIALKITKAYIQGKEICYCDMPMTKDKELMDKCHRKAAETIGKLLKEGKNVSFLTLGDPTIYSTVMYVHRILTDLGFDTSIVPGIPSFCGAAASLNVSLCERDEMLHIIPGTFKGEEGINLEGTKVFMKSGKQVMKMKEILKGQNAMMVERATMEDEKVYTDLCQLEEPSSYFSLIVVHSPQREKTKFRKRKGEH